MTNATRHTSIEGTHPIRPRDPRAILAVAVAMVIASLVLVHDSLSMLVLLAFVCAWHVVATGSLATTGTSLQRLLPFAGLVVVLNGVFGPGKAVVSLGGLRMVTDTGIENGVFFALRLLVMMMTASLVLVATTPEALARGIHDAVRRVSPRAAEHVALFVFLSMGFVPLVGDEFVRIRVAQSFRGGDIAAPGGGLRRRARAVRASLVPLVVSAVQRSGPLAMAVELRDVRHRLPGTMDAPHFAGADAALLASTAAIIVVASRGLS